MRLIDVDGRVTAAALLRALGLEKLPEGCELSLDDEVEIAVTADADGLWEELEDDFRDERETIPLEYLKDAIAALRDGDAKLAMVLFDSVFDGCLSPEMGVIEPALLRAA